MYYVNRTIESYTDGETPSIYLLGQPLILGIFLGLLIYLTISLARYCLTEKALVWSGIILLLGWQLIITGSDMISGRPYGNVDHSTTGLIFEYFIAITGFLLLISTILLTKRYLSSNSIKLSTATKIWYGLMLTLSFPLVLSSGLLFAS